MPSVLEIVSRMGCVKSFKEMETTGYVLSRHATKLIATENRLVGVEEGGQYW